MNKILFSLFFALISNYALGKNIWIGEWIALDQWQSEFSIVVNENGKAFSNYGNGDNGTWTILDGNLKIIWDSGKSDYFFSGVMGFQRISRFKESSYTSGLQRKLSD